MLSKCLNFITELNRINSTDKEEMSNVLVFMFIYLFFKQKWVTICKKAIESIGEEMDKFVY